MTKYNKAIVAGLTGIFGVLAAFGLDLSPETQAGILSIVPFLATILVYLVPNDGA